MNEKDIFVEAFEIADPAEREDFLSQASGGDADLRGRVNALLEAYYTASSFLGSPAASVEALTIDLDPPGPLEGPGTLIGPYKLLQSLGEGGMGAVYMAEQEHPVKRRVALKIIKAGLDTKQVIARFEQERQALALMDHPNIARVLDAGTTAAGRPYFVMELVKGIPLTKLCDRERLSPRERLELFIPVCHAVQHAHQKGIIHRDLKPSNVLVALYDGHPVPKVIDFGVAKATTQKLTQRTMFTEVGSIIGTLEYMAPEQAELNNLDIDTRADIYSLGVILYELLTGSPPFTAAELRSAAFSEMLRMIREVEPPKPSTRLSSAADLPSIAALRKLEPARLESVVSGELDWIVMKCLDKDRGRRYEAANGLAADIERYLRDEPVLASPASRSYRLRRLARKNRKWIATGAAFAAILALGAIVSSVLAVKAREAEKSAEEEEKSARANFELASQAVDKYLNVLAEDPELERADLTALKKRLLETAIPFYEDLARKQPQSPTAALERGKALGRLAQVRQQLGDFESSLKDIDQALAVFESLFAADPANVAAQGLLAVTHSDRGHALKILGRLDEALASFQAALALHERLRDLRPDDLELERRFASNVFDLADVAERRDETDAAIEQFRRAEALFQRAAASHPESTQLLYHVAKSREAVGLIHMRLGKMEDAVKELTGSLKLLGDVARRAPDVIVFAAMEAKGHELLSLALGRMNENAEQEKEMRLALGSREAIARDHPSRPGFQLEVITSRCNLGLFYRDLHRFAEGESQLRQAIEEADQLSRSISGIPQYQLAASSARVNLGVLLGDQGRDVESEKILLEAVERLKGLSAEYPKTSDFRARYAMALDMLANTRERLKKLRESISAHRESLELLKKLTTELPEVTEYRQRLVMAYINLAYALSRTPDRDDEEGLRLLREGEELARKLAAASPGEPLNRVQVATILDHSATTLKSLRRFEESMKSYLESVEIREKLANDFPQRVDYARDLGAVLGNVGMLLRGQRELDRALEWLARSDRTLRELLASHPQDIDTRRFLRNNSTSRGWILTQLGRNAEASAAWKSAEELTAEEAERGFRVFGRAFTSALAGEGVDRAAAEVRARLEAPGADGPMLYNVACLVSLAASAAPAEGTAREKLAVESVASLREAIRKGYTNAQHIKVDPDLAFLRERDDFKQIIQELGPR